MASLARFLQLNFPEGVMKVVGIVLVVLGVLGLVSGGLSWTRDKKVIDAGPIELTTKERKTLPIPPLAGGVILVAGVALLMKGK